jgi:hypothetical protein
MSDPSYCFERDSLSIVVHQRNGSAFVAWRGVSDARDPGSFLNPVLQQLSERLAGLDVTVDFTALEYMNSATVAPLIKFVKVLDTHSERVRILFADADWQRIHLQCMRTIARTLKRVEVEGR